MARLTEAALARLEDARQRAETLSKELSDPATFSDGRRAADEHVAQRFPARLRVFECLHRGRDRVILLMFVNVVTSAADTPQPRAGGSRLRVTMVERNGSWVVGDVDAI